MPGLDSDFIEPYVAVSHTLGPVTGKILAAYAPKQNALSIGAGKEDNFYLAGDLSAGIPGTPLTAGPHTVTATPTSARRMTKSGGETSSAPGRRRCWESVVPAIAPRTTITAFASRIL